MAGIAQFEEQKRARLLDAVTALAIERYRVNTHHLPDSLTDSVPKYLGSVPVDPYGGRQLRYKKLAKGYVVYSVGQEGCGDDEIDDGGDEQKDISFTVER